MILSGFIGSVLAWYWFFYFWGDAEFDGLIGCSGSPCTGSGHSIMAADYQLIQEFETFRKKR
jgi:hypothetical protein